MPDVTANGVGVHSARDILWIASVTPVSGNVRKTRKTGRLTKHGQHERQSIAGN